MSKKKFACSFFSEAGVLKVAVCVVLIGETMSRKSSSCSICEKPNLASICAVCVNYRYAIWKAAIDNLFDFRVNWRVKESAWFSLLVIRCVLVLLDSFTFIVWTRLLKATLLPIMTDHWVVLCRLNEYNTALKSLKSRRDSLYLRLSEVLVAKVWFICLRFFFSPCKN